MDKKNTVIGVLLLLAAFASLYLGQRLSPQRSAQPTPTISTPQTAATGTAPANALPTGTPSAPVPSTAFASVAENDGSATTVTLQNDFIAAHVTDFGGALHDVALKKYPAERDRPEPFVFNALHADPMLALVDFPGLDRQTRFELVSHTPTSAVYRAVLNGQVEVTRHYSVLQAGDKSGDPYVVRHETTFRNLSDQTVTLPRVALSLGTAAPTDANDPGIRLTTGYSNGDDQNFFARSKLEGGNGFFGIGASEPKPQILTGGPIAWACVSNQFFASILTPDQPGSGLITRRVKLLPMLPDENRNAYGITSAAQFDLTPLAANAETKLGADFYVGPKEYRRLANGDVFKKDQDKVMQFGFFKFFSQILLTLMTWVHGWFPSAAWAWGWAVVITTLILKIIFVPFTLAASRSAKRMAKIQPEMQAVREKFKDNPQKLQAATMELFKKHKVNPMGGCFPILITIPFFIGFFQMLQSAAELRFQPFLWAYDLSAPDTVLHIGPFPLNIMPLLMGATIVIQMRLTPSPAVDNMQVKMMKFMPYIMTMFCYTFSCALALYSTVNGIFTIGQQLVINRMKDNPGPVGPGTAAATTAAAFTKSTKNVTPKKKK
ncbi:membrane protein insertase YidC [Opitutus terrae]|uniref:Membrane protein insertase YidC n=1 Tax=Opitutus terrae (strain DSM 11246 / JCM 15787 / PB90-1) TaxID=452637 RepID=B1ZSR2_OPITP|nr:membrane protein insertase YidC [Opitutus terrae]ACB74756.1 60 kDa inner membrane insertion protein [Opitutus terrae PB90-1]